MKRIIKLCYIIFFICFSAIHSSGQTCCSGGVPLANNIGGLPDEGKGAWQFSLNVDGNYLRTLKDGSENLNDDSRERTTYSILFKSAYSLTDRLTMEMLLTSIQQEREINQNGFEDFTRTRGLGDGVFMLYYTYLSNDHLNLTAGVGPKIPMGPSDLKNENGITLNADLQPGSGAWDAIFHHRVSMKIQSRPSALLTHLMTYRLTGANDEYLGSQIYEFGNEFQMVLGISELRAFGNMLSSYGLNFRYRHARQDRNNHEWIPNTGGQWVFIMPAFSWYAKPNLALTINAEVPVFSEVTGTQLTPTFRINTGVYFTIKSKKEDKVEIDLNQLKVK